MLVDIDYGAGLKETGIFIFGQELGGK